MKGKAYRKLWLGGVVALSLVVVGFLFAQSARSKPTVTVYESPT